MPRVTGHQFRFSQLLDAGLKRFEAKAKAGDAFSDDDWQTLERMCRVARLVGLPKVDAKGMPINVDTRELLSEIEKDIAQGAVPDAFPKVGPKYKDKKTRNLVPRFGERGAVNGQQPKAEGHQPRAADRAGVAAGPPRLEARLEPEDPLDGVDE